MSTSPRHLAAGRAGFTLAEILILVLILAIMAAVVIPNIGSAADVELSSAAQVLVSDLENTRSMALTAQVPYSLIFNTTKTSYKVATDYAGGAYDTTTAVPNPARSNATYEVTPAALNGAQDVTVFDVEFGTSPFQTYVTFNSDGTATPAGYVTLKAGSSYIKVSVDDLTGAVTAASWHP
jgi:Tfp pilus assembly protein FimT